MRTAEVFQTFESTWNNCLPERRLAQLEIVKKQIPEEHIELFESMLDAKISGIQDNPDTTVVLLIHGIQTDGAWQQLVQKSLSELSRTYVHGLGYECVSAAQLASPVRGSPVKKITQDIRDAKTLEPAAKFVVIAHSFGSYILSKVLSSCPDISFEKIILCGCIIPTTFPWAKHTRGMPKRSIINDVGTRDFYPVLATFSSVGYGASGRKGFQSPHIKDRYFDYDHSDFFEAKYNHIEKFWKPFISSGEIIESEWDQQKPKNGLHILMLSHPILGKSLIALGIFLTAVILVVLLKLIF